MVSCLMGDSTALASAIVRCCPNSAAQPGLSVGNILTVKTLLPPIGEQVRISEFLDNGCPKIDEVITEKQSLIDDLESYKKSLIYEVVTGKRRV